MVKFFTEIWLHNEKEGNFNFICFANYDFWDASKCRGKNSWGVDRL